MRTLRSQKFNFFLIAIFLLMVNFALEPGLNCAKKRPSKKKSPPKVTEEKGPIIRLGVVPAISAIETVEQFQPLMDYLSKKLKARVKLVLLEDYDSIIKQMESKELEGGIHGSFSAYVVQKKLGAIPVARPEKNGVSTYRGLIFTRKDSGIKKISDLKGKSFIYTDVKTSAGYVYQVFLLKKLGYDPNTFFGRVSFAGRHDLAVLAVLNGDGDAGAAKDTTYFDLAQKNPRINDEMVIINSSSGKFPEKSLVVRKDLDPALIQKLKRVLLEMDRSSEGRKILKKLNADRYIESPPSDWADVEEMAKTIGIPLE